MPDENHPLLRNKRQVRNGIRCMNNGKFYRNPDREKAKMWSTGECAKYYLCIGKGSQIIFFDFFFFGLAIINIFILLYFL